MSRPGSLAVACGVALAALTGRSVLTGQEPAARDPVMAKASAYVRGYTKAMSSVVCEERQLQRVVKHDGKVSKRREIVSEVLFVDSGGNGPFDLVVFRDVFSVDGKPVRNRETRVRELLLKPREQAYAQAVRITNEGARYNIGGFEGAKGNVDPLVQAIWWFGGDLERGRFTRTAEGVSFAQGTRRTTVERGRAQALAVRGGYVLDAEGRVSRTTWATDDPSIDYRVTVRYQAHPALDVLVPAEMQLYRRMLYEPKTDTSEGSAAYSNCRQFQVTVEESVKELGR